MSQSFWIHFEFDVLTFWNRFEFVAILNVYLVTIMYVVITKCYKIHFKVTTEPRIKFTIDLKFTLESDWNRVIFHRLCGDPRIGLSNRKLSTCDAHFRQMIFGPFCIESPTMIHVHDRVWDVYLSFRRSKIFEFAQIRSFLDFKFVFCPESDFKSIDACRAWVAACLRWFVVVSVTE